MRARDGLSSGIVSNGPTAMAIGATEGVAEGGEGSDTMSFTEILPLNNASPKIGLSKKSDNR